MGCKHYNGSLDNVYFQFGNDEAWYGCYQCYGGTDFCDENQQSVRCTCGATYTPAEYRSRNACRNGCAWNPGCKGHWNHYFETGTW